MWHVYIDNLGVIEVCDWSDVSELIASGNRSLGKEVVRALRTKALGDQVDSLPGVIGSPSLLTQELLQFTLSTLRLNIVGKNWIQILAGRWVRFPVQT